MCNHRAAILIDCSSWRWQVRICTRMGVQLVSTDFNSKDYYSNIRKAMVAGYFMQVRRTQCCNASDA